jgi:hypothetical protein
MHCPFRAEQRDECAVTGFRRYREPSQFGVTDIAKPSQQRMTASSTQYLLRGPQSVASPRSAHN